MDTHCVLDQYSDCDCAGKLGALFNGVQGLGQVHEDFSFRLGQLLSRAIGATPNR